MVAFRPHSPDEIEHARTLYEGTDVSPRDIAKILGIGVNTFYRRVKRWGWRRRRLRVEEVDAMALAAAESDEAGLREFAAAWREDRRSAVERARDAIFGEIAAIEDSQARVALAARSVVEGERSARTLLLLARALSEIDRLERARGKAAAGPARARAAGGRARGWDEDEPLSEEEDAAMRADLVRRIHALSAQMEADETGGGTS